MRHGKPLQRPCARPGCEGIVSRRDTVTKFCSRRCSRLMVTPVKRPGAILINGEREATPIPATKDTWWIGLSMEDFYAQVRQRYPALSVKYGSRPVTTSGEMTAGFLDHARELRRSTRRTDR